MDLRSIAPLDPTNACNQASLGKSGGRKAPPDSPQAVVAARSHIRIHPARPGSAEVAGSFDAAIPRPAGVTAARSRLCAANTP